MTNIKRSDALDYHRQGRPGKIEVKPTKPLATQNDLSLAYSPGVADAVLAIDVDPIEAYSLTAKANLVAVVSNGTAILGLGDRGALASKPVMEGKGVLFKKFADIDVFDIELDAHTIDEVVNAVKAIAPTFGGINLEDIKAPEAFEIEKRLQAMLDIPVFHDDQHGTAIISGAALMNACEVTNRQLSKIKVVVIGAGAAAIASANFYLVLGVQRENITMVDLYGVVRSNRQEDMDPYKAQFVNDSGITTLEEALEGADVVLGLSAKGVLKPHMLEKLAPNPIIFAMANPIPEIMPDVALAARPDAIIGTGRSDFPNQVNNVLGFPFIFRGALDVYARQINEPMKLAAAKALAELAHEDVPDSVLNAYSLSSLRFGREYLIPKPFDPRVLLYVAPAVARAAMESGVARRHLDLDVYRESLFARQGYSQQFRSDLITRAKNGAKKRILFAEGNHHKIIRAAAIIGDEGIAEPILLGNAEEIQHSIDELGLHFTPQVIDMNNDPNRPTYVEALYKLRQRKGVTKTVADSMLRSRNYYGAMMVKAGFADVCISGLTSEYPQVIRPALQIVGTQPHIKHASGVYMLLVKSRVYFLTDATVNIDPDAPTLAEIAINAADFANSFGFKPRVAMLSFSNFGSAPHPDSTKVRDAVALIHERRPDLKVDGEMQADTAVVANIVDERYPFSTVRDANVLVFPDLGSANIAYKLLHHLGDAQTIGPILLGMGAPIHVLQAGDDVEDIVSIAAVAVLDAQSRT
ncbi:MAG: NADP-dependent malic enzyme [Phototrophicaceae bacterium]